MTDKKNLSILLEAVNILKTECLLKSEDTMKIIKYDNKTIKPRPNGKGYYVRYRDANGQHSLYGKTPVEVLNKLKKALKESPKRKSCYTVMEWWHKFLEVYENDISEGTLHTYKSIENCYITKIGNMYLEELTVLNMSEFIRGIKSTRQRIRAYNMLRRCLSKAKENDLVEKNVFELIPQPKHKKNIKAPLTEEEQNRFLEKVTQNKYGDLFLLMLMQGLRIGETLAITRQNIDFENNTLSILQTYSNSKLGETKTESSKRIIPLFESTIKLLDKYKSLKPTERLFNISQATAFKNFKRIIVSANLNVEISPHCLRKTFGTRIFENGVPLLTISKWLGHADTKITEACYVRVTQKAQNKWLNQADFLNYSDTQTDTQLAI